MKKTILIFTLLLVSLFAFAQDTVKIYPIQLPEQQVREVSISYDGTHLLLLTTQQDAYYLFEYVRDGRGDWSEPRQIFTSSYDIQGPSYSPDNNRIYLAAKMSGDFDIYYMDRTQEGWTEPQLVDSALSSGRDERSPMIGPQGRILYFARDEGEKEPCTHLFFSVWYHGHWQAPQKLVAPINLGCEDYPRLAIDGQKIFFISHRESYKSFDIYYTKKITQEIYTTPQRFAFSHNRLNEISPAYDPVLNALLFVRKQKGELKVFYVKLNSQFKPAPVSILRGKIVDKETGQPLQAVVSVLNPITNSPLSQRTTRTGQYQLILPQKTKYTIEVTGRGLSTSFLNWDSHTLDSTETKQYDFQLFDKVNLQLNIFDKLIYDRLSANIKIIDSLSGDSLDAEPQELDKGKYLIRLPIGGYYSVHLTKENYNPYSFTLDLRVPILYQNLEKDMDMEPRLQRVVLKVVDAFSQRGVETEVEVVSKKTGARFKAKLKTDAEGNVVLFLKKGDVYEISITPRGYTFYSQELSLEEDTTPPQEIVAKVKPLEKDLKMQFHNITFELNSADLKEEAFPVLDQLVKFLKQNPGIKVEISAHTDDLGSEQYNQKLSLRRANAVVEYLKEHGISPDRMIAIGYGESRPLVPNDSDEHRAMNRRVEFKIIEIK